MPVLIILASETFVVVVAGSDRALLWPLRLMGKHVSFDVLEKSATLWDRATASLFSVFVVLKADRPWALLRVARVG